MSWRSLGVLALCLVAECLALPRLQAEPRKVGIVDLHVDLPYQHNYQGHAFASGTGQVRARELERAGVVGVVLPLYIPRDVSPTGPRYRDLESSYVQVFGELLKTPPYRLPGCTPQRRAVSTWLSFEGAAPLADHPDRLPLWVARGVRLFGLVHSYNNELAGSSGDPKGRQTGLSRLGRELVSRIQALGGVVDVSHASDLATEQMIAMARDAGVPVVATHSNARALAPHPRNLTDAQIRGIAATGGVIGVNLHQRFLAPHGASASLSDLVRNIQHIEKLVGSEHLALGTDFEGGIRPIPEITEVGQLSRLADALRRAGMSETAIAGIFHKNALRILCPRR